MGELEPDDADILAEFKAACARSATDAGTGDPSLDLLLATTDPPFRSLILDLAVPHWFDHTTVSAISLSPIASADPKSFVDLLGLPFVRPHERGFTYHDSVRDALRSYLVKSDVSRFKAVSGALATRLRDADGA